MAVRLGGAIWHFWWTRGYWSEGRRWLDSALAAGAESDPQLRFDALIGAGILAVWQGDVERGGAVADELLALAAESDSAQAGAILFSGLVADRRGDEDHAAELWEESARLAREQGDLQLLGMALNNLGSTAHGRGSTSARWSCSTRAWP
jgi:tetratricopeptide (TPR) repeat protein